MVLPSVTVAATISWTAVGPDGVTPASGDWSNFNNWTDAHGIHRLPAATDDVTISAAGSVVDHYSGIDTVHSLNVTGNLTIDGGTLTVTNGINLTDGAVLTLGPTATMIVSGTQGLEGNGTVVFSSNVPSSQIDLTDGTTWTIGSGITVDGNTGTIGPVPGGAGTFSVVNDGTVGSSLGGGSLFLNGGSWNNQGIIEALNGSTTDLDPAALANVSDGTLTGGTWKVAGSASAVEIISSPIHTNDAAILLDGTGAALTGETGGANLLTDLTRNQGSLTLLDGAILTTDAALTNSGLVDIEVDSTLNVGGVYTQTAGTTIVNGTLTSTAFLMNIDGGILLGDGTVFAVVNPPSAAPSTLHRQKVPAPLTLSGLTPTYNGGPEAVVATTMPAGLPVDITYNGTSNVPTDAGSYTVTATIDDLSYQGSATGTLVIGRATPTVTVTPVNVQAFDGQPHATTGLVTGMGGGILAIATISYNSSDGKAPVHAGSYTATASFAGNLDYTSATGTASISIAQATPTVTVAPVSVTYDGKAHGTTGEVFGVDGVDLGPAIISYSGGSPPVNAGSFMATATFAGNTDYTSDRGTAPIDISRATPATVNVTPVSATYDAQAHGTTAVVTGVGGVSLGSATITYSTSDGSAPVDAGSYTATGSFPGNQDYTSASGTATISIARATPTVTVTPVFVKAFDGHPHGTTGVVTGVDGISLGSAAISYNTASGNAPVDTGSYTATGTFAGNTDYTSQTGMATISIGHAIPTMIDVVPVNVPYDSHPHGTTGEVFGVNGVDLGTAVITYSSSGNTPVDAGTYTATGSFPGNQDYSSATATANIIIHQVTPTVTVTPLIVKAYDGQPHTTTGVVTGVDGVSLGSAVITYSSGSAPVNVGSYIATGSFAGDIDYTSASNTAPISIGLATAPVSLSKLEQTYDGSPEAPTATTVPAGLTVDFSYSQNGQVVTNPTAAGSYAVTATVDDPNYQGSATGTLVISQAPTITSAHASSFAEGMDGTFIVTTANGIPTPALQETGILPSGVTFTDNHDGTATLAGVPADGTEGSYILLITATNPGTSASQTFALNVLTPQESGSLFASVTAIAENGQASADVTGAQDVQTSVDLTTAANGPAALWVASYVADPADQAPTAPTPVITTTTSTPSGINTLKITIEQAFVFLDVRVTGVDSADGAAAAAVFTFPGNAISAASVNDFAMQFWDGQEWRAVLSDGTGGKAPFQPTPKAGFDAHGNPIWTVTVLFDANSTPTITSLKGTVFTLALPTTMTTTTTVISPPQVLISTHATSDAGSGLASSATFASNGQVSLILRVSNENEYTASRTAVGGGGGGDITFLPETDDVILPWLRDVPWLWDILRSNSATPPAAAPRRGAAAEPARPAAAASPATEPPAALPAPEESEVRAIDAFFTETESAAPEPTCDIDFIFDETDPGIAMAGYVTPAPALAFPFAAAALTLTCRKEKPVSRGRKYRPALECRR